MSEPTFTFGGPGGPMADPSAGPVATTNSGTGGASGAGPIIGASAGSAPSTDGAIKDATTATFMADVIEASAQQPVLVDFWAPWCGPCKQLTPILEKVVRNARGAVKLVKMNIDENPEIPGQMGIQSIPAVVAFSGGRPLDAFQGVQTESQIQAFIERVAGPIGPSDGEVMMEQADAHYAAGDLAEAAQAYGAVLGQESDNLRALGGLTQCHVQAGNFDQASQLLESVPPAKAADPAIAAARAALDLARQAENTGDLTELQAAVDADEDNHQARFDLAVALGAHGRKNEAVDALIEIVRRDRAWDDDAARKQLVQFFEAWGFKDPGSIYGRRKLSSVLFS